MHYLSLVVISIDVTSSFVLLLVLICCLSPGPCWMCGSVLCRFGFCVICVLWLICVCWGFFFTVVVSFYLNMCICLLLLCDRTARGLDVRVFWISIVVEARNTCNVKVICSASHHRLSRFYFLCLIVFPLGLPLLCSRWRYPQRRWPTFLCTLWAFTALQRAMDKKAKSTSESVFVFNSWVCLL